MRYDRPSKPLAEWCTKDVRLSKDVRFAEFEPGDGTRYTIVVTNIDDAEVCRAIGCAPGARLITLANFDRQSMFVDPKGYLHYSYVEEKLNMTTASAVTLCQIISTLTGVQATTWDEFEERIKEAV